MSTLQNKSKKHYDQFPFDFLTENDEKVIENCQPTPFKEFVQKYVSADDSIIDVGCGPGRATLYLLKKGFNIFSLDLSKESINLARNRAPHTKYICTTNLLLPIDKEKFDVVVSDGVIHHTPDAQLAFKENARILKKGGYLYCAVYQRHRYYYYIYQYLGKPVRTLEKNAWGRTLIYATLLPLYYFVHLVKSRGKRTWRGAKNFFYDYIITPQASFHTKEEIEAWGKQEELQLIDYDNKRTGNVHSFVFRKLEK